VEKLAPYLDEIELLLFESAPESLPSPTVITELHRIACNKHVTYNVHLPLDIDLGATETAVRHQAIDALALTINRVQPLSPTSYTLHLACHIQNFSPDAIAAWRHRTAESLSRLLKQTTLPARQICIETLNYPPKWFYPLLEQFDLSVCLDIGHIIRYKYANLEDLLTDLLQRTQIFHLHGVRQGKDHLSLNDLEQAVQDKLASVLSGFSGSVSLEVFTLAHLADSMLCLEGRLKPQSNPST
jgi:endonuclease IV